MSVLSSGVWAAGDCYIGYKAKRNSGDLQLHYGVMQLSGKACQNNDVLENEAAARLASDNWTLLRVVSVLDESELSKRQEDAGEFYLKY